MSVKHGGEEIAQDAECGVIICAVIPANAEIQIQQPWIPCHARNDETSVKAY